MQLPRETQIKVFGAVNKNNADNDHWEFEKKYKVAELAMKEKETDRAEQMKEAERKLAEQFVGQD